MSVGLTNQYVEKTGGKLLKKNFLGCYPCDLQPTIKTKTFSVVFNLSKHNEEGSHFVCIYSNKQKITYFDSFGESCFNPLIKKFLCKNSKNRKVEYNDTKIQDNSSNFCGVFCLAFLMSQERQIPIDKFVAMFDSKNLTFNDKISTQFIKTCKLFY